MSASRMSWYSLQLVMFVLTISLSVCMKAEFFKALGLKKQDYEEARQQESFGTFENSSQDDEDLADVENLEFFPWASNKFSFKPHST